MHWIFQLFCLSCNRGDVHVLLFTAKRKRTRPQRHEGRRRPWEAGSVPAASEMATAKILDLRSVWCFKAARCRHPQ